MDRLNHVEPEIAPGAGPFPYYDRVLERFDSLGGGWEEVARWAWDDTSPRPYRLALTPGRIHLLFSGEYRVASDLDLSWRSEPIPDPGVVLRGFAAAPDGETVAVLLPADYGVVVRSDAGGWSTEKVFSNNPMASSGVGDLAFSDDGCLHLAYVNEDPFPAGTARVLYGLRRNTTWTVGEVAQTYRSEFISVSGKKCDEPVIAYLGFKSSGADPEYLSLTVLHGSRSTWTSTLLSDLVPRWFGSADVATDNDGAGHVAFGVGTCVAPASFCDDQSLLYASSPSDRFSWTTERVAPFDGLLQVKPLILALEDSGLAHVITQHLDDVSDPSTLGYVIDHAYEVCE